MAFIKNLGDPAGWSGPGRTKVRDLAISTGPDNLVWLRSRRFGAEARNKGGHLQVKVSSIALAISAILWSALPNTVSALDYRRYATDTKRKTIDYPSISTNPGFQPTAEERWVGGGYAVQLRYAPPVSGVYTDPCDCWISLVNTKSGAAEVLSLDPVNNVPGANISFNDAAILPGRMSFWQAPGVYSSNSFTEKPSVCATGWDASVQGYGFCFMGRASLTDKGPSFGPYTDKTPWDFVCWYGNTATRTLTKVTIPGTISGMLFSGLFRVCTVGPGQLMAMVCPFVQTGADTSFTVAHVAYPNSPCLALRSDDYGRSWYTEDVPELQTHLYRAQSGVGPTSYFTILPATGLPSVCGFDASTWHACPMGGGRIGMLLTCGKADNYTYVDADFASPPAGYDASDNNLLSWVTRYKFFISDATGRNFVLKASPMDSWDGESYQVPQNIAALATGTWSSTVPACAIPAQYQNPISTAGPGSFFIGGGATQSQGAVLPDYTFTRRWCMAYTLDYGDSWVQTGWLDNTAAIGRESAAPIHAWHVSKPVSDSSAGEILTASISADTSFTIRVFKSDITFATLTKVYEDTVPNYYWQPNQTRLGAVYMGDPNDPLYPQRVFPGYTEFQKP